MLLPWDGKLQLERDLLLIKTMKHRWIAPRRRRLSRGQRRRNDAAVKDVLIKLSKEECAGGTVQSSNYVKAEDAKILSSKEECVLGMGQRGNYAAMRNALIAL